MQESSKATRFRLWLAVVGVATLVLGATYSIAQQSTRLSADDLPLQTAQTVKHELENGANPDDTVPGVKTNLKNDSTVFVIVTDNTKHVLASSATLDNQTPLPPTGVFSFASAHGNDHFTWQPADGVRMATRVLTYGHDPDNGFIITGQSLGQSESRIDTYGGLALAGWIAAVAWASLTLLLPYSKASKLKVKKTTK